MQSLARKINNLLGITAVGQATKEFSLPVVLPSDYYLKSAPPYGYTAHRGSGAALANVLDSETGAGLASTLMGTLSAFRDDTGLFGVGTALNSAANIKAYFDGSNAAFNDTPVYVVIPFEAVQARRYTVYIQNILGVSVDAVVYSVGFNRKLFGTITPFDINIMEVLHTDTVPNGSQVVYRGSSSDGAAGYLVVSVAPAANPSSGEWMLAVQMS